MGNKKGIKGRTALSSCTQWNSVRCDIFAYLSALIYIKLLLISTHYLSGTEQSPAQYVKQKLWSYMKSMVFKKEAY